VVIYLFSRRNLSRGGTHESTKRDNGIQKGLIKREASLTKLDFFLIIGEELRFVDDAI